jgi:hypothetical protein
VVRDPQSPDHLAPAHNSGDDTHPNDAQQAIAGGISLALLGHAA